MGDREEGTDSRTIIIPMLWAGNRNPCCSYTIFARQTYCNPQIQIYCLARQLEMSLLCCLMFLSSECSVHTPSYLAARLGMHMANMPFAEVWAYRDCCSLQEGVLQAVRWQLLQSPWGEVAGADGTVSPRPCSLWYKPCQRNHVVCWKWIQDPLSSECQLVALAKGFCFFP